MSTAVEFPSEIIEEILYRLPVKSLGRFKWVSAWRTLISEHQFIRAHFNRNSSRYRKNTIGISSNEILYSLEAGDSAVNATELSFLTSRIFSVDTLCLCNGLVLTVGIDDSGILINPTTREYSKIRPSAAANLPADGPYFRCNCDQVNGFGYDSTNDDYKFVKLTGLPDVEGIYRGGKRAGWADIDWALSDHEHKWAPI